MTTPAQPSLNPERGGTRTASSAELEAQLRAQLDNPAVRKDALVKLADLFRRTGRHDEGMEFARAFVAEANTAEDSAFGLLGCGVIAESKGQFAKAVMYYWIGLECPCRDLHTQYFLLNNLGFSFNQLGRFAEAEPFLRRALDLGMARGNAHKNLGLSLKGQGRLMEAAVMFAQGSDFYPQDPRNRQELIRLHRENPGLLESHPTTWTLVARYIHNE